MLKQLDLYKKLSEVTKKWEVSQSLVDFEEVEAAELEFEKAHEYQTAADRGLEEQVKCLKAMDYGDLVCDGWRRFFVCKALNPGGGYCGFAYPSKLWLQVGRVASLDPAARLQPGNWKYKCCCMWEYLEEEAHDRPESAAADWFKDMLTTYGEITNFPHVGCGARYVPWKRGSSMVCEINMLHASSVPVRRAVLTLT